MKDILIGVDPPSSPQNDLVRDYPASSLRLVQTDIPLTETVKSMGWKRRSRATARSPVRNASEK
jgi:hypothetical protein